MLHTVSNSANLNARQKSKFDIRLNNQNEFLLLCTLLSYLVQHISYLALCMMKLRLDWIFCQRKSNDIELHIFAAERECVLLCQHLHRDALFSSVLTVAICIYICLGQCTGPIHKNTIFWIIPNIRLLYRYRQLHRTDMKLIWWTKPQ